MVVSRHDCSILHHVGGGVVGSVYSSRVLLSLLVTWRINNRDHTVTMSIIAVVI